MTKQQRQAAARKDKRRATIVGVVIIIGLLLFLGSMVACDLGFLHGWWAIASTGGGLLITLAGCLLGGVFR